MSFIKKSDVRRAQRFSSWLLSFLLIFAFSMGLSADKIPNSILKVGEQAAKSLKADAPPRAFPFGEPGTVNNTTAKVGFGFQVYKFKPNWLNTDTYEGINHMITHTGIWRLAIEMEGCVRTAITVAEVNEEWQMVGVGGAQLAGTLQTIMSGWPDKGGYKVRFVRVPEALLDFVAVYKGSRTLGIIPLSAASELGGSSDDPHGLIDETLFLEALKELVRARPAAQGPGLN